MYKLHLGKREINNGVVKFTVYAPMGENDFVLEISGINVTYKENLYVKALLRKDKIIERNESYIIHNDELLYEYDVMSEVL